MSGDGSTPTPWEAVTRPSDGQIFGRDKAEYIIPASATYEERDPRCVAEFALARCLSVTHAFDPMAEAEANARRIVAAVNATADIPVEALEAGVIAQILEAAGTMWETLTYVSEASECQASREAAAETMRDVSPALALAKGEAA